MGGALSAAQARPGIGSPFTHWPSFFTHHSSLIILRPRGVITTVVGGAGVFRGNGGPATLATLGELDGVAVDRAGNVFAADVDNNLVVRISPAGVLTVVAGNGIGGFSGDGGPATRASVKFLREGWTTGLATDSAGNLYIADFFNNRVRKVTPGGAITTVAGNGQYGFSGDGGPAGSNPGCWCGRRG